jgi:peptidoglycan/LPS O-acetylase OafA/YrhL
LSNQYPALHGLRCLAIVSVLQVHVSVVLTFGGVLRDLRFYLHSSRVWFGMDLFFVLSGFLIGTLLLAPGQDRGPRGVARFYARRAFRIVPLYYVVLTALALLPEVRAAQRAGLPYEYLYLTNYNPFRAMPVMPWAWSLCIEEHFYLAVPLVLLLLRALPSPRTRVVALAAVMLAGFAVRLATIRAHAGTWTPQALFSLVYLRTHTRFDTLAAGLLVAHLQHHGAARARALFTRRAVRLLAWGLVAAGCWFLLSPPPLLGAPYARWCALAWGQVTGLTYGLLLLLLLNADTAPARVLGAPFFRRAATLGYGIYLVHIPLCSRVVLRGARWLASRWVIAPWVLWVAALAALAALSALCAYGLHLAVEKPSLWLRERLWPGAPALDRGARPKA